MNNLFGKRKIKSSGSSIPSLGQFQQLGSAVMDDPEAREQFKRQLIAWNDGKIPTDAKALATKIIVKSKAMGVRRLPNRMALANIIEALFEDDGADPSDGDHKD